MYKKVKFLAFSLLFTLAMKAQDNTTTIVNEQFSTLLESLLVDGKITEAGAKSYLEAVYGYDEGVSSYLQTTNLQQQILSLKQGNLKREDYLQQINTSLINVLPTKYKEEISQNLKNYAVMKGSIDEVASGKIGENSFQLIAGIIQGIKEGRDQAEKERLILQKVKAVTPTLASLAKNQSGDFIKSTIKVPFTDTEWKQIPAPDWSKHTARLNKAVLSDKGMRFEGEWQNYNPPVYQFHDYFKNTEKFDFSKDFKSEFEIIVDNSKTYNFFEIQLAGMYRMSLMCYQKGSTNAFTITTPKEYFLTNKLGVFYNSQDTKTAGFKTTIIRQKKSPCVDYTKPIKITMQKTGSKLTFQFNDCSEVVEIDMNYFFNKHLLEFRAKGDVQLVGMTLEHL